MDCDGGEWLEGGSDEGQVEYPSSDVGWLALVEKGDLRVEWELSMEVTSRGV